MTTQICLTHWMMASGVPEIVTARSVELGSMSPATWTWAPVDWSRVRYFEGKYWQDSVVHDTGYAALWRLIHVFSVVGTFKFKLTCSANHPLSTNPTWFMPFIILCFNIKSSSLNKMFSLASGYAATLSLNYDMGHAAYEGSSAFRTEDYMPLLLAPHLLLQL